MLAAFFLSVMGFFIDWHERVPNVWVNLREILMITLILFGVFSFVHLLAHLLIKLLSHK